MSIVMGVDQHRAQITAEWIDLASGEISRARVRPRRRPAGDSASAAPATVDGPADRTAGHSSDRGGDEVDGQQVRQAAGELVGHQHAVIRRRRGRSGQRDRRQPRMVEQHRCLGIGLA
jgi:hypothetical protein